MALSKTNKSFESDDTDLIVADDATKPLTADEKVAAAIATKAAKTATEKVKPADEEKAAAEPSKSTDIAAPAAPGALAVKMAAADPFKKLENAIKVDYNTLDRIMVNNGNVINKETKGLMGDTCVLELISIQKNFVMSPGGEKDDEEALEFLKYSDDGVHCRDTGELLATYQQAAIKGGYPKARIVERLILVGMVEDAGKLSDSMNGNLVQLDLAPRSKANFEKHRISVAFRIGKGLQKPEGAERVKITCDVQNKGSNTWTDALFSTP